MLTDEQRKNLEIALAWCPHGSAAAETLRELLAAHSAGAQEPVAWMRSYRQFSDTQSAAPDPGHMVTSFHQNAEFAAKYPDENTPLYAHPQPMPQAQPVYDKSVVRRLATQWGMISETDAARDAFELLRKFMEYRDSGYVPNVLFDRARTVLGAEIERLDRAKGE